MRQISIATTSLSLTSRQCKCSQTADTSLRSSLARKEVPLRMQSSTRLYLRTYLNKPDNQMTVVSADAAYCYDRVNHVIMLLVWLVLTNSNIQAIVMALICLQMMKFFQRTGFGESKTFFGGANYRPYDGPGAGEQGSATLVDPTQCGISE